MTDQPFYLLSAGRHINHASRLTQRGKLISAQQRHPQLVGKHLHGRRQIERGVARRCRNMRQRLTAPRMVAGQSGRFVAEHECNIAVDCGRQRALHRGARVMHIRRNLTRPRRRRHRKNTASERFVERADDLCSIEHIVSTAGARPRHCINRHARGHQGEARQAHHLDGACGCTKIAGVTGFNQHDAHLVKQRIERRTRKRIGRRQRVWRCA